jgi:DNA polymerase-3 subunit gamma/tau
MNLYLKYRPETLQDVVGNEDVVKFLTTILEKEERPQVYLFNGPTGCGKTTLARILSRAVGCDSVDIREINTADFRGIDSVREMIKASKFHSIGAGGSRAWIIDEAHKMTNDAQNALLKLLEDSPKGAYFFICTTEPEKLFSTVRGRCIDLTVKLLNEVQMQKLLKRIVRAEKATLQPEVYEQIIQDSFGHPRNAIQILEKVLNVDEDKQLEMARASAAKASESIQLCRALIEKSPWKKVSAILEGLKEQDPESIRRQVLGYCQSILLKQSNDKAAFVMEMFQEPFYNTGFPGLVLSCYTVVMKS